MSMSALDCYLDSKMDELLHRSSDINGNFSQNLFSQYEREEIERFVNVLVSENQKLQVENEKLREEKKSRWENFAKAYSAIKRAERIDANDLYERSSEASHYNWLDDEIERVENQNQKLQTENEKLKRDLGYYLNEIYNNLEDETIKSLAFIALEKIKNGRGSQR